MEKDRPKLVTVPNWLEWTSEGLEKLTEYRIKSWDRRWNVKDRNKLHKMCVLNDWKKPKQEVTTCIYVCMWQNPKCGRSRTNVNLPSECRVYDGADGDEQQRDSVRFIEELDGDVIDRPLVDAGEAVGRGVEPVTLGMIGDVIGDGVTAVPSGRQAVQ